MILLSGCVVAFLEAQHADLATSKFLGHGTVRSATWVGVGLGEVVASGATILGFSNARRPPRESHFPGRPVQHGVSREPTIRASRPQPAPKSGPRPSPAAASQSPSASPPGHAQAVLKALKGLGLPDALLQQVHQSLSPPQKPFTSRHRQLAHLDEQLKALKNRIQRQTLAVERHREQGERMQEKLLNMHVEEDKLKEGYKVLQNSPPSQSSSRPGTPVAVSAGASPPASEDGDAPMEDSFGPLPLMMMV